MENVGDAIITIDERGIIESFNPAAERITGWSQSLIKVRAFRARRKLKKLFEALQRKERT